MHHEDPCHAARAHRIVSRSDGNSPVAARAYRGKVIDLHEMDQIRYPREQVEQGAIPAFAPAPLSLHGRIQHQQTICPEIGQPFHLVCLNTDQQ